MRSKEKFTDKKKWQKLSKLFIYITFIVLIFFLGCTSKKDRILAYVNGEKILAKDFIEFYNSRPRIADWSSKDGRLDPNQVLNALVDKILMAEKAQKMNLDSSPEHKEQLNRFEEKVLVNIFLQKWFDPKVHITDDEVQAGIPEYQKKEIKFARICVLKEDEAWEIKKKLEQGEDFFNLARRQSIGIDAENGGIRDFLSPHRGIYPKKVIEAIFNLPIGKISMPMKIREGYSIFKPIEERPLNSAEMEQIVHYQRNLLFRERKNKLIRELLTKAKKERDIIIHYEAINKISSQKGNLESQFFNPILAEGEGILIYWKDFKETIPQSVIQGKKTIWEDPNLVSRILKTQVDKDLLVLEAKQSGFEKDPDLKKELYRFEQDLLARQLMIYEVEKKIVVTEDDCRKYYQESLALFSEPEMIRVSHILLKDKEKAEEILFKLKNGEEFNLLAEKYSEYKVTSRKGGDMGYIKSGESGMGQKFDQVASSLQTGEVSELVETSFGYQIISVTDRKPARTIPFEEIQDKIRQEVFNQKRKARFNTYLKSLRKEAKIKINQDLFLELIQGLNGMSPQELN